MEEDLPQTQHTIGYLVIFVLISILLIFQWQRTLAKDESARISTAVILADRPLEKSLDAGQGGSGTAVFTDTAALPILQDTSLSPNPNPYTLQPTFPAHDFQTYRVKRGDTPVGIAAQFGIKPETLLGGNPFLSEVSNALQPDVELIILPVDGLLHDVQPGDTLEELVDLYGVPVEDIIAYAPNNLEFPYRLQVDTQIVVPGATRDLFFWEPPTIAEVRTSSYEGRGVQPLIVGTGSFIWPITSRNFTQFYWYGHPAIDVAATEGSSVVAADTGTVTFAGWNTFGYGNLVVVNHGNGYETFYAHMSRIDVVPGQIVYQGNRVGAVGNTGNSSGPHLHLEVRLNANRDDPCWYVGC